MVPEAIPELPEHWQRIREPLAAGDRHDAVKRLRLIVDHDPFALAPRHVLASLLADAGHGAVALVQYEKLLTAAVTRGDLYRAIVAQRRVDGLSGRRADPTTYIALQRWFRLAGEANLLTPGRGADAGLTPVRLLRLPADAFTWVALGCRLQRLEVGWHIEPFEGVSQWHLMWGALRWEVGRRASRSRQRHVAEGESLFASLDPGDRAPLRVAADVPSEAVVLDSGVLHRLAALDPLVLTAGAADEIVRETRGHRIARPRAPTDLDLRARVPDSPPSETPPSLTVEYGAPAGDSRDWLEPGLVPLNDPAAGSPDAPPPPAIEIAGLQRASASSTRRTPAVEPARPKLPAPRGRSGDLELPVPAAKGSAGTAEHRFPDDPTEFHQVALGEGTAPAPRAEAEVPVANARRERRGGERTPVQYRGHVRLLGLGHALGERLECRLVDLSPAGAGIEMPADSVLPLVRMLEGETLRIELDGDAEPLELAGRVCWLDLDGDRPVRAGLEFALLTRTDRRTIRRLIGRARREGTTEDAESRAAGPPPREGDEAA